MERVRIVNDRGYYKLITLVPVLPGEVIFRCSEDEVTPERTLRTIQIGSRTHLQNDFLDFINHACFPSSVFEPERLAFVARQGLESGSEVTFFYPGTETRLAHEFECNCAHPDCLGYIVGGLELRSDQMRAALDRGLCTPFVADRLRQVLAQSVVAR
ncbi:MAG: SET domain-containing protein-lysine N-methyltransferase [Acidobacteriota bacterium]